MNVQFAAFAAAGAFVLSALVGMIAGVRTGTVVARALFSAIIFGAAAAGLSWIAARFLPGLVPNATPTDSGSADGVPDVTDEELGSVVDVSVGDEEMEDDDDRPHGISPDMVEEVQEAATEDPEQVMKAVESEERGGDIDIQNEGLDRLPDIGSFAGSFSSDDYNQEGEDDEGESGVGWSGDTQSSAGNDPVAIAKALQTMLQRDKE